MKGFVREIKLRWKYARFRTRLLVLFVLLSLIQVLGIGIVLFQVSRNALVEQAQSNFLQSVQKTSTIVDRDLDYIEEFSIKLNADSRIFEIFGNLDSQDPIQLKNASNQISDIILNYLPWNNSVYSAHLVTSYYRFGEENKNFYPEGSFLRSEAALLADEGQGRLVWIPTYNYREMFAVENISSSNLEYENLFSAIRKLHPSNISTGRIRHLPDEIEEPYLVINFKEENLQKMLEQYLEEDSPAQYLVMTSQGDLVCSPGKQWEEQYKNEILGSMQFQDTSACLSTEIQGEQYIVAYSQSAITGWYVAATVPVRALTDKVVTDLMRLMGIMILIMTVLASVFSFQISKRMNRKIYKPLNMIENVGAGNFESVVSYNERDEFAFFYSKLNEMNTNLKNLVHENYEVKLQKRDSEIMALNIQMNPHFLYNALNIIHWICLNGDKEKASSMLLDLSRMLQYTSRNDDSLVPLKDDLAWLERYLAIMSRRYEKLFTVHIDIPEEYGTLEIPKLFLQPFVENAIVHAFKEYREEGRLEITVEQDGDDVIFCVEDNGCGMTRERITEIMNQKTDTIGILNTDKRIKMIYGSEYRIEIYSQIEEGTTILIHIPDNRTWPSS